MNSDIAATSSNVNESFMFWFFNNGITIVCDGCDIVDNADNPHMKLKNLQIVNGCQTSMTLAAMESDDGKPWNWLSNHNSRHMLT